jgi:hypothetical protein
MANINLMILEIICHWNDYSHITYIDFMSIDIEGHEMNIFNTIDFKKYSFGFITIVKLMKKNNYKIFIESGSNILFIPNE